jgi:hypothetical protein
VGGVIRREIVGAQFFGSGHALQAGQWCHVALVAGSSRLSLYANGQLVATNEIPGSFAGTAGGSLNLLGGCTQNGAPSFHGQMDEVRLWRGARTAEQIRENMAAQLTGREPGLLGLWNFDDPINPGRDATTNRLQGKLIGQAQAVPQKLPVVMLGRIADATGRALTNAYVEVRRRSGETSKFTADPDGNYAFTLGLSDRCDLFATDGERSAYRLAFQPSGEPMQRLIGLTETERRRLFRLVGRVPPRPKPFDRRRTQPSEQLPGGVRTRRNASLPAPGCHRCGDTRDGDDGSPTSTSSPVSYQLRQTPGDRTVRGRSAIPR